MQIIKYSLGQLQANCYFLIKDNQCLIIDPADEASFILEELERRKLKLVGILATHGHFDHLMVVGEIQLSLKVPLHVNKKDLFLINRLKDTANYFLGYKENIIQPKIIKNLKEGELKIKKFKLKIIWTPGHTPGSGCFYFPNGKVIFTGDTLFKEGIGRYDFSYSSKSDLANSLKKLFKLPDETVIYPGHGETSTVDLAHSSLSPAQRR